MPPVRRLSARPAQVRANYAFVPSELPTFAAEQKAEVLGEFWKLLELRPHRLGERGGARVGPHHDGQLADEPVIVEAQEVEPVELAVADARLEDQRRGLIA